MRRRSANYEVVDGILFYKLHKNRHNELRPVIPASLRVKVLEDLHDLPICGHMGIRKTFSRVREAVYWPRMKEWVSQYVRSCDTCQKVNYINYKPAGFLNSIVSTFPNEIVGVDLLGPYPRSASNKFRYILVIVDHFSKWIELVPLKRASTKAVSDSLINKWIMQYGAPVQLISDNGTNLTSQLFEDMCRALNIRHSKVLSFRPQSNISERVNRNVVRMISAYVEHFHPSWDQHLNEFAFALRTAKHDSTKRTPAEVFLGRKIMTPLDRIFYVQKRSPEFTTLDIDELMKETRTANDEARAIQKKYYDKNRRMSKLKTGDYVLKITHSLSVAARQIVGKFCPKFNGPFLIKSIRDNVVTLQKENGELLKANVDQIKRYYKRSDMLLFGGTETIGTQGSESLDDAIPETSQSSRNVENVRENDTETEVEPEVYAREFSDQLNEEVRDPNGNVQWDMGVRVDIEPDCVGARETLDEVEGNLFARQNVRECSSEGTARMARGDKKSQKRSRKNADQRLCDEAIPSSKKGRNNGSVRGKTRAQTKRRLETETENFEHSKKGIPKMKPSVSGQTKRSNADDLPYHEHKRGHTKLDKRRPELEWPETGKVEKRTKINGGGEHAQTQRYHFRKRKASEQVGPPQTKEKPTSKLKNHGNGGAQVDLRSQQKPVSGKGSHTHSGNGGHEAPRYAEKHPFNGNRSQGYSGGNVYNNGDGRVYGRQTPMHTRARSPLAGRSNSHYYIPGKRFADERTDRAQNPPVHDSNFQSCHDTGRRLAIADDYAKPFIRRKRYQQRHKSKPYVSHRHGNRNQEFDDTSYRHSRMYPVGDMYERRMTEEDRAYERKIRIARGEIEPEVEKPEQDDDDKMVAEFQAWKAAEIAAGNMVEDEDGLRDVVPQVEERPLHVRSTEHIQSGQCERDTGARRLSV